MPDLCNIFNIQPCSSSLADVDAIGRQQSVMLVRIAIAHGIVSTSSEARVLFSSSAQLVRARTPRIREETPSAGIANVAPLELKGRGMIGCLMV